MEAMACGLPVILTDHCGGRVPDESWRVPVRDSNAIAQRLSLYADDRARLSTDSERAVAFSRSFPADRYRAELSGAFLKLCR